MRQRVEKLSREMKEAAERTNGASTAERNKPESATA